MDSELAAGFAAHDVESRPVGAGTLRLGRMLSRAWSLPGPRSKVSVRRGVRVPMTDGTVLIADHYIPEIGRPAPTVLARCPYGRGFPYNVLCGLLVAQRGYHALVQSCRGTFGSGGEFEPFRNEASDGQDTVAWLRTQDWFSGRLATYGMSYLGFVQWALAMDPPPELAAMVMQIGPHDFSTHMYRNGAFDLHTYLGWSQTIIGQEEYGPLRSLLRVATAERRMRPALSSPPLATGVRDLLGGRAPWFERWLAHPDTADPYWQPLQCGAALERLTAPALLIGGWQDLFIEQTIAQYIALTGRGVPARLVIGPWAHLDVATKGGAALSESLDWLDRHLADSAGDAALAGPDESGHVRVFVGGGPGWRELASWPPPGIEEQRWYLGPRGALSQQPPESAGEQPACFRYNPADPTPSVGGALLARTAGVRDNSKVERRSDVLVFTSAPLAEPVEVIGEVAAEVSLVRDNAHADLFVRLCDVDQGGRSRNLCDGIVRLTTADPLEGTVRVSLIGAAHRFERGHRLRLQVCGGAYPHFARNPGTGGVDAAPSEMVGTEYRVSVHAGAGSALILPVVRA